MDLLKRIHSSSEDWLARALRALEADGCAVVEGVLDDRTLDAVREGLYCARRGVLAEVGAERLERAGEIGVVRLPMKFAGALFALLQVPEMLALVDATVSPTAVLHLQNGLILPPLDPERHGDLFQLNFHMDFRRVLNGYLCSINTLFAIDEFRASNGATLVVPGTHQRAERPTDTELQERAVPVTCPAGSMLVFDSTLWHASGRNLSGRDRLAVNQQFTRSYFKQQIDYVRALGSETVTSLPPRTQQLLGWYTRVATNLDEFYRPAEERLYRAGQG